MSGLHLSSMRASDMLDVIHAIFEDENTYTSAEHMESRTAVREAMYRDLYGVKDFKYRSKSTSKTGSPPAGMSATQDFDYGPALGDDDITPFNPKEQPTKPLIQATPFDPDAEKPFGSTLDAPLG